MKDIKFSFVIPCYNEEKNIPLILNRLKEVINREDIEIILVNNGSTDNSQEVFNKLLETHTFARLVQVAVNKGYGFGILQGLKSCSGSFLGWTHADMQTDPNDLIRAIEIVERRQDDENLFIKGHRRGRALGDELFTVGMSIFESIYLQTPLYDINAQPNLFSRKFFNTWENPPHDFALDLYALYMAKKRKQRILRFDVRFPDRIHGESKWNTGLNAKWKFIKRTINFSVSLKKELSR